MTILKILGVLTIVAVIFIGIFFLTNIAMKSFLLTSSPHFREGRMSRNSRNLNSG
jgi:uncharacterized protein YneF (UPF0154 family)